MNQARSASEALASRSQFSPEYELGQKVQVAIEVLRMDQPGGHLRQSLLSAAQDIVEKFLGDGDAQSQV